MTSQAPARWKRLVGVALAVVLLATVWRELRRADSVPSAAEAAGPVSRHAAPSESAGEITAPAAVAEETSTVSGLEKIEPLRVAAKAHTAGDRHRVQVVGSDGAPLAGAFVRPRYEMSVETPEGPIRSGQNSGTRRADGEGWIEVQLWQGPATNGASELALNLQASVDGRQLAGRVVDPRLFGTKGQTVRGVRLEGLDIVAKGRVVDGCGRPLRKVFVELWWLDDGSLGGLEERPARAPDLSSITAPDGQFELGSTRTGSLRLEVTQTDWPRPEVLYLKASSIQREVMLHCEQGLRGALDLPIEVEDLAIGLAAGNDTSLRFRNSYSKSVKSGECFEVPVEPGQAQLRLGRGFVLWEGEVAAGATVELPSVEISRSLVPLSLRVSGPHGEVDSVQLFSKAAGDYFFVELSEERRMVLPEAAFPLKVFVDEWLTGTIEREGGYERHLRLERSFGCEFEFDSPPGFYFSALSMRVTRLDSGEPFVAEFIAVHNRASVRLPGPGRYRVDYLCPDTSVDPKAEFSILSGTGAIATYRQLPTLEIELGAVELRDDEKFPPGRTLRLYPEQLPRSRHLLPGELPK